MRKPLLTFAALLILPLALAAAQVATGTRPKGATAVCKDGTFYTGDDRTNACKRNGGLQEWWGKTVAPTPRTDTREPYDKAEHPKPVTPPAGAAPPH
jgi:hypothetical protein